MDVVMNPDTEMDRELYQEIVVENEDTGNILMEEPFNPSLIDIDTKSPTISLLIERLKESPPEIDLYPDFQRSDDLWDEEKQSQLIESILIKFPLPAFYFDGTDDNKWLVVDGLQRLSSLRNFMITKTLTLKGLEFLKELNGKKYDELARPLKREIDQTQITAYIIKPGTPPKVKYNIFKRINTGGLVLTPQEIRHALNQGTPAKFIARLAQSKEFRAATENRIDTSRMLDREFATRFVAFYINDPATYVPDLDSFLNNSMAQLASLQKEKLEEIERNFRESMRLSQDIFGKWAFRKSDLFPERRKPINKALFEVWSVCLAKLNNKERARVREQKGAVMQRLVEMLQEYGPFWDAITSATGDKTRIILRFKTVADLLKELISD